MRHRAARQPAVVRREVWGTREALGSAVATDTKYDVAFTQASVVQWLRAGAAFSLASGTFGSCTARVTVTWRVRGVDLGWSALRLGPGFVANPTGDVGLVVAVGAPIPTVGLTHVKVGCVLEGLEGGSVKSRPGIRFSSHDPWVMGGVQALGTMRTSTGSEEWNTENQSVTGATGFSTSLWAQPVMIVQPQSTTVSGTFRCHGLAVLS
jgi:hypothetical protein